MKFKALNPITFTFIPALAILPVAIQFFKGMHSGGVQTLYEFLISSLTPSLNTLVVQSAWEGIQITIAIALLSWIISILIGIFLGIISSDILWLTIGKHIWIGKTIRRILAIPRALHEGVWGLLLLQVLGLSPWVAIIALIIPYSSLTSRVIANQLDTVDRKNVIALRQTGASAISSLATSMSPVLLPLVISYGGYRLECAIRGATILGIFGLGGIGTELQLSLRSLQFHEMWTSIWMLAIVMLILEKSLDWGRRSIFAIEAYTSIFFYIPFLVSVIIAISFAWLHYLDINLFESFKFHSIYWPSLQDIFSAFTGLPLVKLVISTCLLTLLSGGIAIGVPPLLLLITNNAIAKEILSLFWLFLRLIPPPLTALIFILVTTPSISVAALALGFHSMGVMGRMLKENLDMRSDYLYDAINSTGASNNISWLYGKLSLESKKYLTFASYRIDVVLRETAVIGVVGGIGLGWQLQESLSSFYWAEVVAICTLFIILTIIGESISEKARRYWQNNTSDLSLKPSL